MTAPYNELLQRIGIGSIQDMLITINCSFQGRALLSIMNLIKTRDHKYNLRGIVLNMVSIHLNIMQRNNAICFQTRFATRLIPRNLLG